MDSKSRLEAQKMLQDFKKLTSKRTSTGEQRPKKLIYKVEDLDKFSKGFSKFNKVPEYR